MSFRLLSSRLAKHGRYFLQTYYKRDIFTNILEQTNTRRSINAVRAAQSASNTISQLTITKSQPSGIFRFGQHARKLFIDNILSRVTSTYSQELCNKATKKLFYGDSAPFFALVGVSLASGAGVLTKDDELEGVCYEIREAAARLQNSWNDEEISNAIGKDFNIDMLNVGPAIAKGCAAVVYAASFKTDNESINSQQINSETEFSNIENSNFDNYNRSIGQSQSPTDVLMTPIQNISRFVHNFGGSVDNLHAYTQTSLSAAFTQEFTAANANTTQQSGKEVNNKSESIGNQSTGFSGISSGMQGMEKLDTTNANIQRYPLALKMMFNYDIQSNALSILRAMYKETVPARYCAMNASTEDWQRLIHDQTTPLPPHPNIVLMFGYFCGQVGNFPDGHILYPIAQPPRINPQGYGRNMSLYLLMKRYDQSLRNFLDTCELSSRTKLLLFTQLLEAIVHIGRHGIAHRDLKSDNILIERNSCGDDNDATPILVLSDFGCCLADKTHGLKIPYTSHDIDKGGNAALMAPEIINKQPGPFSVLNYSKADLWACGAIAYEIFGLKNPFYSTRANNGGEATEQSHSLRNNNYKHDDLPELTDNCPMIVQELIYNILDPNPSKRISPDIAANVMQLFLWAPSNWLKAGGMPSSPEVLQWLLSLSTKIMCEGRKYNLKSTQTYISYNQNGHRTYVEYLLICSFLARARLRRIRGALSWIQGIVA